MGKTKDSIDWSHVHEWFKWMARDNDGDVFLYVEAPDQGYLWWEKTGFDRVDATVFTSYKQGTCGWQDSLVERP